jgi:hypothetical protein
MYNADVVDVNSEVVRLPPGGIRTRDLQVLIVIARRWNLVSWKVQATVRTFRIRSSKEFCNHFPAKKWQMTLIWSDHMSSKIGRNLAFAHPCMYFATSGTSFILCITKSKNGQFVLVQSHNGFTKSWNEQWMFFLNTRSFWNEWSPK